MTDIVRVLRILEYTGPHDWVEKTLSSGAVPANGQYTLLKGEAVNPPIKGYDWCIKSAVVGQFPEILEVNTIKTDHTEDDPNHGG